MFTTQNSQLIRFHRVSYIGQPQFGLELSKKQNKEKDSNRVLRFKKKKKINNGLGKAQVFPELRPKRIFFRKSSERVHTPCDVVATSLKNTYIENTRFGDCFC